MDDGETACGCFVVSGREAPGALWLIEASLDPVSQSICEAINRDRLFAICSTGNDGPCAAHLDVVANVIGIVATIRDKDLGSGQICIGQNVITLVVRDFAGVSLTEGTGLRQDWRRMRAPDPGNAPADP